MNYQSFTLDSLPSWDCPKCNKGKLELNRDDFIYKETGNSVKYHSHPDWGPDWVEYLFTGILRCSHCREIVVITGTGNVELPYIDTDDANEVYDYSDIYDNAVDVFYPKMFFPSLDELKK